MRRSANAMWPFAVPCYPQLSQSMTASIMSRLCRTSTVAAFGDQTHPRGYQQFEAIGYQRGPDGKAHTADDVALGPVDVTWSIQVFHAAEGSSSDFIGTISPLGLFTPATGNPNNNFDVWAIATATKGEGSERQAAGG